MTAQFDVTILGAGAAGLMCAIEAGKRGRKVAVLEHNHQAGKKILISGGGRANFTNLYCKPENFISSNPHFCKSALARYTPKDFISLVERHRIPYHEKKLGQLFCDRSARDITSMLEQECNAAGVRIFLNCPVRSVRKPAHFLVETGSGEFVSPALVVATGGLSLPKIGATPLGYRLAERFGVRVRSCRPGLVPLTFPETDKNGFCDLAGVSTEVIASLGKQRFREKLLITHRGLSGPAILQISSYWSGSEPIRINLLPQIDIFSELKSRKARGSATELKNVLGEFLPKRLAETWCHMQGWSKTLSAISTEELAAIASSLCNWQFAPGGTEGYDKAEVTCGGVDPDELSSKTFECRKVSGLFFVGEVLDVTGQLGGFNFQWAWASGYSAGQYV